MPWGELDLSAVARVSEIFQHAYFWIAIVAVPLSVWIARYWRSRDAPSTLLVYVKNNFGSGSVLDRKLLNRLSCAIVDDKPEDFPIEFMRGFFGSVVVENSVSLNDARRLSKFDVIFLDVADVVAEDPRRGGALLIDRIREHRKDSIIVSVSSKKYDVEVTRYFEAADIRIRKPILADSIDTQFVAHFANKVGPEALAAEIDKAVTRVGGKRALRRVVRRLKPGVDIDPCLRIIQLAGVENTFYRFMRALERLDEN